MHKGAHIECAVSVWKVHFCNIAFLVKSFINILSAKIGGTQSYQRNLYSVSFQKWAISGLFRLFLVFLKQTLEFLLQINVKKTVYGAGIWTHHLQIASLIPKPKEQGSR